MNYLQELRKQFIISRNDDDFTNWLKKLKKITDDYKDILYINGMNPSIDSLELNKGLYDSISSGKTLVVSRYANTLDKTPSKLIISRKNIRIKENNNIYPVEDLTYYSHNPYTNEDLLDMIKLYKFGKDIVLGFYGYDDDLDRIRKRNLANYLKLNSDLSLITDRKDNEYFYILKPKKLKLRK